MSRKVTTSLAAVVYAGTTLLVACTGDIETLPPPDYNWGSGGTASSGAGSGGTIAQGSSSGSGGTSAPGVGGTSAMTGGSGGSSSAGSSAGGAGGAGGSTSTGGTAAGGSGGVAGTAISAGKGGAGPDMGGKGGTTSAGGAGAAGRGGMGGVGGRAGAAGAGAASGAAGAAGGSAVSFAPVGALIDMTCALADCHGGKERPSLTNDNLTTLYNTLKNTAVRQCGSDRLVTPSDPANSALLELVQHQCGTFVMPDGCKTNPCISAADMATITDWIQAGAPAP